MALFKRLKKDIGIEEEEKNVKKEEKKPKKTKKKELKSTPTESVEKTSQEPAPEKKVPKNKEEDTESITKAPMSSKNKDDSNWLKSKGQLSVDVYQTDESFCVQAPIAGVDQNNLDIAVENEMLIIKGERREPNQDKDKKYLYQECYWGPFSREVMLPEDVFPDKIKASLKNGILLITVPKSKKIKKKITIEVG